MKQRTVFYSWQSDLPNSTNRSFIGNCLTKAIKGLRVAKPELDVCLDRDTASVPGSPDILATILDKIDNCHLFVCDISIIQGGTRPTPNPNVLFELGYAVKRLGWNRVICVANSHFGAIESLPFDVRQHQVKSYALSPEITDRAEAARSLTSVLRSEIELILTTVQEEGERIQLQFGEIDTKTPFGTSLQHRAVFYSCDLEALPDYDYDKQGDLFGGMVGRIGRANRDYHRQMVQYIQHSLALRKIGFVVFNGNPIAMNDLTMEIVVKKSHGLVILDDEPIRPSESEAANITRSINPITSRFARPGKV